MKKELYVNGAATTVIVDPAESLAGVLRRQLGLTGTKIRCGRGRCGRCSVILEGMLVRSCVTTMQQIPNGAHITTVEGIGSPHEPHPVQLALVRHHAPQCGYCMPGTVVAAKALLDQIPNPNPAEIRAWFRTHGIGCRCHGSAAIVEAILDAAAVARGEMPREMLGKIGGSDFQRPAAVMKAPGPSAPRQITAAPRTRSAAVSLPDA